MKRRETRIGKIGKRGLLVIGAILVCGVLVSAGVLSFVMQSTMTVSVTQKDVQIRTQVGTDDYGPWTDMPATFITPVDLNGNGNILVHFEVKNDEDMSFDLDLSDLVVTPVDDGLSVKVINAELNDPENAPAITTIHIDALTITGFDVFMIQDTWAETMTYTVTLDIPTPA